MPARRLILTSESYAASFISRRISRTRSWPGVSLTIWPWAGWSTNHRPPAGV